jgi:hypothetical protein
MQVSRDLLSRKSPLLGLLSEVRLSLLSPVDILLALSKETSAEDAITLAPYLRDPWTLRFLEKDPQRTVLDIMEYSRMAIPALIGEIFLEEDRFMSEVYEAIIRSVADGRNTLKEVADRLFSMKLIRSADPSSVRPYVKIMEDMDLIERIPVFDGRGNHYAIRSKVMDLYYCLDEKYGPEAENPDFVRDVYRDRMPFHVQFFLGELMAEILGGGVQVPHGRGRRNRHYNNPEEQARLRRRGEVGQECRPLRGCRVRSENKNLRLPKGHPVAQPTGRQRNRGPDPGQVACDGQRIPQAPGLASRLPDEPVQKRPSALNGRPPDPPTSNTMPPKPSTRHPPP